jgi:protein SCO1
MVLNMKPLRIPLAFLALIVSAAAATDTAKAPRPETCEVGLPPGKYSEKSIYRLDSTWHSDTGRTLKLSALQDRPVVLALFFTSCSHSCPIIVAEMKQISSKLARKSQDMVTFVLVSIDPERDSLEALKAFREKHSLAPERWTLLRGQSDAVKELAGSLGFIYAPGSATQFAHSLLITVLNGKGEVAFQQAGLGVDRSEAVVTLKKLLSKD